MVAPFASRHHLWRMAQTLRGRNDISGAPVWNANSGSGWPRRQWAPALLVEIKFSSSIEESEPMPKSERLSTLLAKLACIAIFWCLSYFARARIERRLIGVVDGCQEIRCRVCLVLVERGKELLRLRVMLFSASQRCRLLIIFAWVFGAYRRINCSFR